MRNAANFGWVAADSLRKKRPERRRLEPEPASPPCRGSAPRDQGWAVADPSASLALPEQTAGTSGFSQPLRREAGREGPRPRAARPRAFGLEPLRPAAPRPPLPRKAVQRRGLGGPAGRAAALRGHGGRSVRGLCVPPRHVATPRALQRGPRGLSELCFVSIKPKPQEGKELWFEKEA